MPNSPRHPLSSTTRRHIAGTIAALSVTLPLRTNAQAVAHSPAQAPSASAPRRASAPLPLKFVGPPTTGAITARDLMTRVYKFADDSMMGREAGTVWNDKGTDYIAGELKRLGLTPAGENGTYFQNALDQHEIGANSFLTVGDERFSLWTDFAPRYQGSRTRSFDGLPSIFGGTFGDSTMLPPSAAVGKVVVVRLPNGKDGRPDYLAANRNLITRRFIGAAAIAVEQLDYVPPGYVAQIYQVPNITPMAARPNAANAEELPTYFYVTRRVATAMLGVSTDSAAVAHAGRVIRGQIDVATSPAPGRNVVAILRGSDPTLRGQYVAIGAHNDHVGFSRAPADHDSVKAVMMHAGEQGADSPEPKPTEEQWRAIRTSLDSLRAIYPSRPDSIFNGADDDASGSMTVLEIAERFATAPVRPKRSILFVWHVGEEKGLWGSAYFTDNPTVPRDSIVAQLNVDMVGRGGSRDVAGSAADGSLIRGGPGYLQLIGSRRLSTELGDLVERTNHAARLGLRFDYALDANGHPQNIYCRSDHYMYARYGIPVTFFTTGGHADYHQVSDEPQYLDYPHMAQVGRLIHAAATNVANLDHRIVVDKPKPDPRGNCRQ